MRPDFFTVPGGQQVGCKLAEEQAQVVDVAQQHAFGVVVARSVDRLRQIDDDRAVHTLFRTQQNVELRQVTMHDTGAQHAYDFNQQSGMVPASILRREDDVVQARSRVTVRVGDQFHQQHPIAKVIGLGHPHAGPSQAVERIDLGALPGCFLRFAAKLGALGHRPRLAGIFDLAVLGVVHRLTKTAFGRFFVDLGAARVVANPHHIHHGFLATHELAHHAVDQAFVDQGLQSLGRFHVPILPVTWRAHPPAGWARLWRTHRVLHSGPQCRRPSGCRVLQS